jgi:alpha-galactosidase
MREDDEIERLRIPVSDYVRESEENLAEYERTRELLAQGEAEALPIEPSIEYAPQIIHSMVTGQPREVYGNVENTGLIENLPRGACVEVPCLVDGSGLQPTHVGALPPQLAALNRTFLNVGELTVRAALDGRPDHVLQAAMLDPNTAASLTLDQIEELVAELTEAHGDALPDALRTPALARRPG